jgi:AraC-like DNA-binding protein
MIFRFEERESNSPFVDRVWRAESERAGSFSSVATSQWEMVISKYRGETTITLRGPETKATSLDCSLVGAEWMGIIFKHGTVLPYLPAGMLVDGDIDLPDASGTAFWLQGSAWQFPDYGNADAFVDKLTRRELLAHDPIVESALRGEPQELSPRSIQRHFLQATGLTHNSIRQIERARYATILLQQGVSIPDTIDQAGYADQAHLTRSLKYFIGKTPSQIVRKTEPEQLSLLYQTEFIP